MATRVAILSIVVENPDSVTELNRILHEYGNFIIGRMGIPYHRREISLISVVVDAPADTISAMAGKLGRLSGITSKALFARLKEESDAKAD